ncbi:MAG: c-type cytochrome [Vicinamibacterales bacterium]
MALALIRRRLYTVVAMAACGFGMSVFVVTTQASDGAKAGANVFESYCADCHSVKASKNKSGPTLFGVVGRRSASVDGYAYSEGMRQTDWVWTQDKLDAFITSPKGVVANTKMRYNGLSNQQARTDLLTFLAEQK